MVNDLLYEKLLSAIKEKIPQKEITNVLSNLLIIEKEAVYRRLRGEVPFTFAEIAKIAKKLNLSIDTIIGTTSEKSKPFQLKLTEHYNQGEVDHRMNEEFVELLSVARNGKYSEFGFATSVLPLHVSNKYENIERFYVLRWLYQFGKPGTIIPYEKIKISDRKRAANRQFLEEVENVRYTYIIWDKLTMFYIINDILYFHTIRLISDEEVEMLKKDINEMINYLEKLAIKGEFSNGNKIDMYISNLNFETTYTYLETSDYYLTLIKTFTLNETASLDETVFHKMKTWLQTLKRTSNLISGSNELYRIHFFENQRKLVDQMFSKDYQSDNYDWKMLNQL